MKSYSYSPYDSNTRRLKDGIYKAFIKEVTITLKDYIKGRLIYEGRAYTLLKTNSLKRLLELSPNLAIKARVSFQYHTDELVAIVNATTIKEV